MVTSHNTCSQGEGRVDHACCSCLAGGASPGDLLPGREPAAHPSAGEDGLPVSKHDQLVQRAQAGLPPAGQGLLQGHGWCPGLE